MLSIIAPIIFAVLHVFCLCLTLALIPVVYLFIKSGHRHLGMSWGIVLVIAACAAWMMPDIHRLANRFGRFKDKAEANYIGYTIAVISLPFFIPEPIRMARRRLKHERPRALKQKRGVRKRRRIG